jgi:hypothetical protein
MLALGYQNMSHLSPWSFAEGPRGGADQVLYHQAKQEAAARGLPEGSRGLSASDTPGWRARKSRTPAGVPEADGSATPSGSARRAHRCRGYRRCVPQPPATFWHRSAMRHDAVRGRCSKPDLRPPAGFPGHFSVPGGTPTAPRQAHLNPGEHTRLRVCSPFHGESRCVCADPRPFAHCQRTFFVAYTGRLPAPPKRGARRVPSIPKGSSVRGIVWQLW